jgi:hypothetical protein
MSKVAGHPGERTRERPTPARSGYRYLSRRIAPRADTHPDHATPADNAKQARRPDRLARVSILETLDLQDKEVVSMACSGQPADYRDDELDLADDDDPELDLDDLCDRDED